MASLINQVKSFVRSNESAGVKGLAYVALSVDHALAHGDTTPLCWLIAQSSPIDGKLFRAITGKVLGGAVMKEDPSQPSGLRITLKPNAGVTEKMPVLRGLIAEGKSFRSAEVKAKLLDKVAEEKAFDVKAFAKRITKKLDDENVSIMDLLAALREADTAMNKATIVEAAE